MVIPMSGVFIYINEVLPLSQEHLMEKLPEYIREAIGGHIRGHVLDGHQLLYQAPDGLTHLNLVVTPHAFKPPTQMHLPEDLSLTQQGVLLVLLAHYLKESVEDLARQFRQLRRGLLVAQGLTQAYPHLLFDACGAYVKYARHPGGPFGTVLANMELVVYWPEYAHLVIPTYTTHPMNIMKEKRGLYQAIVGPDQFWFRLQPHFHTMLRRDANGKIYAVDYYRGQVEDGHLKRAEDLKVSMETYVRNRLGPYLILPRDAVVEGHKVVKDPEIKSLTFKDYAIITHPRHGLIYGPPQWVAIDATES